MVELERSLRTQESHCLRCRYRTVKFQCGSVTDRQIHRSGDGTHDIQRARGYLDGTRGALTVHGAGIVDNIDARGEYIRACEFPISASGVVDNCIRDVDVPDEHRVIVDG